MTTVSGPPPSPTTSDLLSLGAANSASCARSLAAPAGSGGRPGMVLPPTFLLREPSAVCLSHRATFSLLSSSSAWTVSRKATVVLLGTPGLRPARFRLRWPTDSDSFSLDSGLDMGRNVPPNRTRGQGRPPPSHPQNDPTEHAHNRLSRRAHARAR